MQDPKIREEFNDEILDFFSKMYFTVITVVIDKKEHNELYENTWKYDPYHYCLAVLMERYLHFLRRNNLIGDAMAESRGGKENQRLKKSYRRLFEEGTSYIENNLFNSYLSSHELKIKLKSSNIAGLQLCDLIAHPSRREILMENQKINDNRKDIFGDKICEILQNKYDRFQNKIYGKKLLS